MIKKEGYELAKKKKKKKIGRSYSRGEKRLRRYELGLTIRVSQLGLKTS